jgi:hypothetical protein
MVMFGKKLWENTPDDIIIKNNLDYAAKKDSELSDTLFKVKKAQQLVTILPEGEYKERAQERFEALQGALVQILIDYEEAVKKYNEARDRLPMETRVTTKEFQKWNADGIDILLKSL